MVNQLDNNPEYQKEVNGEVQEFIKSTTKLNTKEMNGLLKGY
jgi:hypothetical protein